MAIVFRKNNSTDLLIFFNGWGADINMIPPLNTMDMCVLSEWHNIKELPYKEWNNYKRITVVGWSFGVLAATHFLQTTTLLNINKTIAINGSPYFIDDNFGIPNKIFQATLEKLSPCSIQKFMQRMWLSTKLYNEHKTLHSKRNFESQKEELIYFSKQKLNSLTKQVWDIAIIGNKDLIFPPQNLKNYWQLTNAKVCEIKNLPHFPFVPPFSWNDFL